MLRLVVVCCLAVAAMAVSHKECARNNQVKVNQLSIEPHPLRLPGTLKLTFDGELMTELDDVSVSLTIKKRVGIWVKIPCVSNLGSCTYNNVCDMLTAQFGETGCPADANNLGLQCMCPFSPQRITLNGLEIAVPDLPAGVGGLISGKYKVEVKISSRGQQVSCNEVSFEIA